MSENQEPKPEAPKDHLAELAALASDARKTGMVSIGEGLALDVGGIKKAFFSNVYCQDMIGRFQANGELLRHEYRADNPSPLPGRFCCYQHAMDAQFSTAIEGMALVFAIFSAEGKLSDEERRKALHGFSKLYEEACAVVEEIKATGGPQAHRPKPGA